MRFCSPFLLAACMLGSLVFSHAATAESNIYSNLKTPLNGCPKTDRYAYKRETMISEKCPSKSGFHVFIEGTTEETLKFILERELMEPLIWDDPDAKQIRYRGKNNADKLLSGEITGTYVEWFYRDQQFIGVVLKRLQGQQRRFEAFRFVEKQHDSYFCHLGGDIAPRKAGNLIRSGKSC